MDGETLAQGGRGSDKRPYVTLPAVTSIAVTPQSHRKDELPWNRPHRSHHPPRHPHVLSTRPRCRGGLADPSCAFGQLPSGSIPRAWRLPKLHARARIAAGAWAAVLAFVPPCRPVLYGWCVVSEHLRAWLVG
eukprot:364304-Chlamydomonas_euryale.AAC.10